MTPAWLTFTAEQLGAVTALMAHHRAQEGAVAYIGNGRLRVRAYDSEELLYTAVVDEDGNVSDLEHAR